MTSQSDVREIAAGRESKKRRFDSRDWDHIAEYIVEEHGRRKRARSDRETQWAEIDRQIAMEPDTAFKKDRNGRPDPGKIWMSEMELPLQAQALEVLTADARRMMLGRSWFRAHAALTDDYLDRVDFTALVAGDRNEVPTQLDQDAANKLVEGYLAHIHRQYDFDAAIDQINAEAFKYGTGVGRARMATKTVYITTARGVVPVNQRLPVLFPRSLKDTYLDDSAHVLMSEGQIIGPSTIHEKAQRLEDLVLASSRGSRDPDNEDGGWMPGNVRKLEPRKDGTVQLLEFEGDLVVPRKTVSSIFIPGAIVTVAIGAKEGDRVTRSVVRFRFRKMPFTSYLLFPYHHEDLKTPYASSPLVKGRPVQIGATQALNRLLDSAALKTAPPVGYSRDDAVFASEGGPRIEPYAQWGTIDQVQVYDIGDPAAMLQAYAFLLQQYENLSGVNAPRLGQQTLSHTTAFAKEAELQRGVVRTVDYVNAAGNGPLTRWLYMEYAMAREALGNREETVFLDSYDGWVTIVRDSLPDLVSFEWFGSAGPQEEAAKAQGKLQSAQLAIQIETVKLQLAASGQQPALDLTALQQEVLRDGGWTDTDVILREITDQSQPGGEANALPAALMQLGAAGR